MVKGRKLKVFAAKLQKGRHRQRFIQIYEWIFNKVLTFSALLILALLTGSFITLLVNAWPAIDYNGWDFFISGEWNPVKDDFGALPFLAGTLLTSFLALLISTPFSLAVAIFLGEYFKKGLLSDVIKNLMELLAAIPSVIYGFWGLLVLAPILQNFEEYIGASVSGVSIFAASVVLAIMIIPYSASIAREVINMTPKDLKEAAYSLGATRYEVIRSTILPYARSGIAAGILLALGRALGETMAVTMVIGNANRIPTGLFEPGNTMASVIANEFTEATGDVYLASLIELGLLLFVVTVVINIVGKKVISALGGGK